MHASAGSSLVERELGRDPLSGEMFLFVSRNRKRAKVLLWDGTGLCLYSKRLEEGRFADLWRADASPLRLTVSELQLFSKGARWSVAFASSPGSRSWSAAHNVVLLGPPGVGKTHLAVGLGVKAVEAGYSVLFLTLETLMTRLGRAKHENRLERALQQLVYARLLVLDEMGYLPLSREDASVFFRLLARRYERGSMIVTQQQELPELGRDLPRPGAGDGDPGSAPPSRDDLEHQGRELPAEREAARGDPGTRDRAENRGGGRGGLKRPHQSL
jgi:hypothetical protein